MIIRRHNEHVRSLTQAHAGPIVISPTDSIVRRTLETVNVFSGRERREGCLHMMNDPLKLLAFVPR